MGDALSRNYKVLSGHERFVLTLEAMARGDEADADRLDDTCPTHNYHLQDLQFRSRMKIAFMITAMACINLRGGLAMVRMARIFRDTYTDFVAGPTLVATTAFLYGRDYGKWECGAIESIGLPEEAVNTELERCPDLKEQLAQVREIAAEGVLKVATTLQEATGEALAVELLSQWEGFGRFCRQSLGLEPMTLVTAYGFGTEDPAAEVLASYPDVKLDEAKAAVWEGNWTRNWERRFTTR